MRARTSGKNCLAPADRAELRTLADAAEGHGWDSEPMKECVAFYETLADSLPWWMRSTMLLYRSVTDAADAGDPQDYVREMRQLTRCIDFGRELIGNCQCVGCTQRRRVLPEFHTFEESQLAEAKHGPMACERMPRFEE